MYTVITDYFSLNVDNFELQQVENRIIAYRQQTPILAIVCMHEQTFETLEITECMYVMFVDYINNTVNKVIEMNKFTFGTGIIFYDLLQTVMHE